jgi:ribosomal protein L11 methyltransferase
MVTALPDAGQTSRLGGRFRIIPAGGEERATDDVILLTASTVFGSGLHPSTRLAVQALAALAGKVQVFPERVLDVGTGSGILAMIAARLGARHVKAVDVCPEAVAVARRNVAVNGLGDLVGIEADCWGRLAGPFDLIIANLTLSVHLRLADHLDGILGSGGELLISGMQGRQQGEIENTGGQKACEQLPVTRRRTGGRCGLENLEVPP